MSENSLPECAAKCGKPVKSKFAKYCSSCNRWTNRPKPIVELGPCIRCGRPVRSLHAKYCQDCNRIRGLPHLQAVGTPPLAELGEVSASTAGAVGELLACADLLARGFQVFRNVAPDGPVDLVAIRAGHLFRIQVTTGQVHVKQPAIGTFDRLAQVPNGRVFYFDEQLRPLPGGP